MGGLGLKKLHVFYRATIMKVACVSNCKSHSSVGTGSAKQV